MEIINELVYSRDATIIQANELIRARRDDLTLMESKIIALAISQIAKNDLEFYTYSCHISELADFLWITNKNNIYRDLAANYDEGDEDSIKKFAYNLLKKVIYIEDKSKPKKKNGSPHYKMFHWVDCFEYDDGVITIRLSQDLKPYLLGLNKLFTQYGFESIMFLSSRYSIRLYELLASFRNTLHNYNPDFVNINPAYPNIPIERNELLFSIKYLRNYFNCAKKYPQTGDFIKWVIESSVKGINKHGKMRLSYRTIKSGRSITHIAFKIIIDFDSYEKSPL